MFTKKTTTLAVLEGELAALRAELDVVRADRDALTRRLEQALRDAGREEGYASARDGHVADLQTRIEYLIIRAARAEATQDQTVPAEPAVQDTALVVWGTPAQPYGTRPWQTLGDSLFEEALTTTYPARRRDYLAAAQTAYTRALIAQQHARVDAS